MLTRDEAIRGVANNMAVLHVAQELPSAKIDELAEFAFASLEALRLLQTNWPRSLEEGVYTALRGPVTCENGVLGHVGVHGAGEIVRRLAEAGYQIVKV